MIPNRQKIIPQSNQHKKYTTSPDIFEARIAQVLHSNKLKYCTSQAYDVLKNINNACSNKGSRLGQLLKDWNYDQQEQLLENYYETKESLKKVDEFTEYYKYYTQTTILYLPGFYKLMQAHRERRKVIQYNRLKLVLNLSCSRQLSESDKKLSVTPAISFNLLSQIQMSCNSESLQQSLLIQKLKGHLEKAIGPNRHITIAELDKNYYFQQKVTNKGPICQGLAFGFRKNKIQKIEKVQKDKENQFGQLFIKRKIKIKRKRNNSCQSLNSGDSTKAQIKARQKIKKKNLSMDNLAIALQGEQGFAKSWKVKDKHSIEKEADFDQSKERRNDVKIKIFGLKDKIRRQKEAMKRHNILFANQMQVSCTGKKCNGDKTINRRIAKGT